MLYLFLHIHIDPELILFGHRKPLMLKIQVKSPNVIIYVEIEKVYVKRGTI